MRKDFSAAAGIEAPQPGPALGRSWKSGFPTTRKEKYLRRQAQQPRTVALMEDVDDTREVKNESKSAHKATTRIKLLPPGHESE